MERKQLITIAITCIVSIPLSMVVTSLTDFTADSVKDHFKTVPENKRNIIVEKHERQRSDSLILCVVDRIDSTTKMVLYSNENLINDLSEIKSAQKNLSKNQRIIIDNTASLKPYADYMNAMIRGNDSTAYNSCFADFD